MTKILRSQHPKYIFFRKNSLWQKTPYFLRLSEGVKPTSEPMFFLKSTHRLLYAQMANDRKTETKRDSTQVKAARHKNPIPLPITHRPYALL
jgi:hypothetical protein